MASTVLEHLRGDEPSWSLEFFPPKTEQGQTQLWRTLRELESLAPSFFSVTYGAAGSTQERTLGAVEQIAAETTVTPVAHLTCVGAATADLRRVVGAYAASGVSTLMALRGDPSTGVGTPWTPHPHGLHHSDELVGLIKSLGDFTVGVAAFPDGHPESPTLDMDAQMFARKVDAGADFAITQFFFEPESYYQLLERANRYGADVPIVPGVLPVTDIGQLERFAALAGQPLPAWLMDRLYAVAHDPAAVAAVGIEVAAGLTSELLANGAPGVHMYTLNRAGPTREIHALVRGTARGSPAVSVAT